MLPSVKMSADGLSEALAAVRSTEPSILGLYTDFFRATQPTQSTKSTQFTPVRRFLIIYFVCFIVENECSYEYIDTKNDNTTDAHLILG